jgi:aspartyl-tRNA(Asn)/glutamyl-tRNA(Gln) amidotransferase subunit C
VSLTAEQVQWVAKMARLELRPDELPEMTRHLDAILDYMGQLQELDTSGVEPLAHPLPVQNVFRADDPEPSLPEDEALLNAPQRSGNFFGVPAVLD